MPSVNRVVVAGRSVPGASDRWPSPPRSPPPVGFARCPLRSCLAHTRTTSRCCARCPEHRIFNASIFHFISPNRPSQFGVLAEYERRNLFKRSQASTIAPRVPSAFVWRGRGSGLRSGSHQRGALGQSRQGLIGQRRPQPYLKSRISASGEQEKQCVVPLKSGLYFAALKTICDRLTVGSDLPLPPRRMVAHRHLKHPRVGLFHRSICASNSSFSSLLSIPSQPSVWKPV
jgi:hypothetical protein